MKRNPVDIRMDHSCITYAQLMVGPRENAATPPPPQNFWEALNDYSRMALTFDSEGKTKAKFGVYYVRLHWMALHMSLVRSAIGIPATRVQWRGHLRKRRRLFSFRADVSGVPYSTLEL